MHKQTLRYVHKLALLSHRYEKRLTSNPRAVLERERVPEVEIKLIEQLAPENAFAFGLAITTVRDVLDSPLFDEGPRLLS